ncbi:putative xanthine dehydrogenase domain protein [Clostridioides difficile DA00165]|nr:putative xanthine dehydrogenase domain protein [Clostridioides difficile DA00165]
MDLVDFQNKNAVEPDDVDIIFRGSLGNPRVLDCIEQGKKMFKWDERNFQKKKENI